MLYEHARDLNYRKDGDQNEYPLFRLHINVAFEVEHQPNDRDLHSKFLVFFFLATRCDSDKILVDIFYELGLRKKTVWTSLHSYKIIYEYMYTLFL